MLPLIDVLALDQTVHQDLALDPFGSDRPDGLPVLHVGLCVVVVLDEPASVLVLPVRLRAGLLCRDDEDRLIRSLVVQAVYMTCPPVEP